MDASFVVALPPIYLEHISVFRELYEAYKARISDLEELLRLRDIDVRDLHLHLNSLGAIVAGMLLLLSRRVRMMRVMGLAGSMESRLSQRP